MVSGAKREPPKAACALLGCSALPAQLSSVRRVSRMVNNPSTLRGWLAAWRHLHLLAHKSWPRDQDPFLHMVASTPGGGDRQARICRLAKRAAGGTSGASGRADGRAGKRAFEQSISCAMWRICLLLLGRKRSHRHIFLADQRIDVKYIETNELPMAIYATRTF